MGFESPERGVDLGDLTTPALLVDQERLDRNLATMAERLPGAGRPTKKERRQTTRFTGAGSIVGEEED